MNPREQSRKRKSFVSLLLLCAFLIGILWFAFASSSGIRFDNDQMLYDRDVRISQYRGEGRIVLAVLLEHCFPAQWNPLLYGLLFLLLFASSGAVLTLLLYRFTERTWPLSLYGLFFLLFGSSPVWAFQFYFTVQAPAVALGMLAAAVLAAADVQLRTRSRRSPLLRILFEAAALLLCTALILIYQSLIIYYVIVALLLLFCRLLRGAALRWPSLFLWAGRVILSLVLYVWIARTLRGGDSYYLMNQIQWGREPVETCLANIAVEFGKLLLLSHSGHFSLYLPGILLTVLLLILKFRKQAFARREEVLLVLCAVAFCLMPLAISILEGSRPVPRTQFSLQLVSAFLPLCFAAEINRARKPIMIIAVLVVLLQGVLVARLTYTDERRSAADLEAANRITGDLHTLDAEDKPLVFIGTAAFSDETLLMEKTDVIGLSFFEWSYAPESPGSAAGGAFRLLRAATGRSYAWPSGDMISEAAALSEAMPSYPSDGYLLETDLFCVIKLSEP